MLVDVVRELGSAAAAARQSPASSLALALALTQLPTGRRSPARGPYLLHAVMLDRSRQSNSLKGLSTYVKRPLPAARVLSI